MKDEISGPHCSEYEDYFFWRVTRCSLVEIYRRLKVLAASIIGASPLSRREQTKLTEVYGLLQGVAAFTPEEEAQLCTGKEAGSSLLPLWDLGSCSEEGNLLADPGCLPLSSVASTWSSFPVGKSALA